MSEHCSRRLAILAAALLVALACSSSGPAPSADAKSEAAAAPSADADPEHGLGPPAATLSIETKSVAMGVGVSWGKGVLRYQERDYPFSLSGISVADVGVSRVSASGKVWGLTDLSQFEGTYYGVQAGMAVGGGGAGLAMRNEHGVYLRLRATQQGVTLSLASQGTTIELD